MNKLDGYRSQITAVVGAVFVAINSFWPDLLSPQIQSSILTILLFLYATFFAAKVQRSRK